MTAKTQPTKAKPSKPSKLDIAKRKAELAAAKAKSSQWWTSALFGAAKRGDAAKCAKAIAKGVDLGSKDKDGLTALMVAIVNNRPGAALAIAEAMTLKQLSIGSSQYGAKPALWLAMERDGMEGVAIELAKMGASLAKRGMDTPLMHAARFNRARLIQVLLDLGADPLAKTDNGCSALWHALRHGHAEAAAVLVPVSDTALVVNRESMLSLACDMDDLSIARMLATPEAALVLDSQGRNVLEQKLEYLEDSLEEVVGILLPLIDPWKPGSEEKLPLAFLAGCDMDPSQTTRVARMLIGAMQARCRPDYEMLAAVGASIALARREENEALVKYLGPIERATRERLELAHAMDARSQAAPVAPEKARRRL